jgi:hypothetical protein
MGRGPGGPAPNTTNRRIKVIESFVGEHAFLSNFFPCKIVYEGIEYPSTEHAFQAAKTPDRETRLIIAAKKKPGQAKHAGGKPPSELPNSQNSQTRVSTPEPKSGLRKIQKKQSATQKVKNLSGTSGSKQPTRSIKRTSHQTQVTRVVLNSSKS